MGEVERLRRLLAGFRLVVLDTMVFSYHLASHPRYRPLTRTILEAVEAGTPAGLTTTITLAELLALPARAGNRDAALDYEIYLTHFPNLQLAPLDAALARETAWVRAETGLRLPDAAQVAAARLHGADALLTNDRRMERVSTPRVILLEDYAPPGS